MAGCPDRRKAPVAAKGMWECRGWNGSGSGHLCRERHPAGVPDGGRTCRPGGKAPRGNGPARGKPGPDLSPQAAALMAAAFTSSPTEPEKVSKFFSKRDCRSAAVRS